MKKFLLLIPAVFFGLSLAGCPSSNTPSAPAGPTPTATPAPPSQSMTITTTGLQPYAIRFAPGGYLWVSDYINSNLQKWTTAGAAATTITTFNSGQTFNGPDALAVDPAGMVYVADGFNTKFEVFSSTGMYLTTFGSTQLGSNAPGGVAVNSAGTTVYGLGSSPGIDYVYSVAAGSPPTYTYQSSFGNSGAGTLNAPGGESFDSQGNLWITDYNNKRVVEFNSNGTYQKAVTLTSNGNPSDVAVDNTGNIFIVDSQNNEVQGFNASGQFLYSFKGSLGGFVRGLTLDGTGTYLYVTDYNNLEIAVFKIH